MVPVKEPAGLGFKIFVILGILFFFALVAGLITTYDTDSDVAAVAPAVTTPASDASAEIASQVPVGAVATGGGGMAGDSAGLAVPIFVVLVVLTMLATTGLVLRRQET